MFLTLRTLLLMIIEYDRKPPEALAYDEWITSGLIEINIVFEILSSV